MERQGAPMILCDIDGVICNNEGIESFDEWERGLRYMEPNDTVIEFIRPRLSDVIFVTGRAEKYRERTLAWFQIYFPEAIEKSIGFRFRLDSDRRSPSLVKQDIIEAIEATYNRKITLAIDDVEDNCAMFRALGITSMQCLTPNAINYKKDPHDAK